MKPRNPRLPSIIDQLICDMQENEWYCEQGGSQSQMEEWEKQLIVDGLNLLLEVRK